MLRSIFELMDLLQAGGSGKQTLPMMFRISCSGHGSSFGIAFTRILG